MVFVGLSEVLTSFGLAFGVFIRGELSQDCCKCCSVVGGIRFGSLAVHVGEFARPCGATEIRIPQDRSSGFSVTSPQWNQKGLLHNPVPRHRRVKGLGCLGLGV